MTTVDPIQTLGELQHQIEVAKDVIEETQRQRNAALDECVKLQVALRATRRVIATLQADADIADMVVATGKQH